MHNVNVTRALHLYYLSGDRHDLALMSLKLHTCAQANSRQAFPTLMVVTICGKVKFGYF